MGFILQQNIFQGEFDYQTLLNALKGYSFPKNKITSLLKEKIIIRVKKGLYVFGSSNKERPYKKEILANLIYGPSFISLEYALSYHGLIPEKVEVVTSVCKGRSKRFDTPIGLFTYHHSPDCAVGFDIIQSGDTSFFMAFPERALADILKRDRGGDLNNYQLMHEYLTENIRISEEELSKLNFELLDYLAISLRSKKVAMASKVICGLGSTK
jgi:predicted transcriptional regulator of viral defense system